MKLKMPKQVPKLKRPKRMTPTQKALYLHNFYNNNQATAATTSLWTTTCATTTITAPTFSVLNTGAVNVVCPLPLPYPYDDMPDDYPGQPLRGVGHPPIAVFDDPHKPPVYKVQDGRPTMLSLPDGTTIDVKADGSYTIDDADAKVVYRANRVHDFNSYLNASDKLESFIKYCGEQGVRQDEMLSIPVRHFIAWLVVEAALADGEEPPAALPDLRDFCQPKLLEAAE